MLLMQALCVSKAGFTSFILLFSSVASINRPKDDWDLSPRTLEIRKHDHGVSRYKLNMANPMVQLSLYLCRKYDGDDQLFTAHYHRFLLILEFLTQHEQE